MPRHQPCREINLLLPVERIEQGVADRLLIGGQVIEPLAVLTRDASWRHIEVASQIERHRAVQNAPNGGDVAIRGRGSDPLEHPVERVGVGEDVVRSFPVAVFVRIAEARDPEGRAVSQRSAKVSRTGASEDCRLESVNDIPGIIAEQLLAESGVV